MNVTILVCTLIMTIAALVLLAPALGFDIRIRGRSAMAAEVSANPPSGKRGKRIWAAVVLSILSLGMSAFASYYFFHPRIDIKTVNVLIPDPAQTAKIIEQAAKITELERKLKKDEDALRMQHNQPTNCDKPNDDAAIRIEVGDYVGQADKIRDKEIVPLQALESKNKDKDYSQQENTVSDDEFNWSERVDNYLQHNNNSWASQFEKASPYPYATHLPFWKVQNDLQMKEYLLRQIRDNKPNP